MQKVVITAAVRTPIGNYMGAFREIPAYKLCAQILNETIRRANVGPDVVDEVIMGQSYQNGESVNIARTGLLAAGWPVEIPGVTLDRRCCSGLDAVAMGSMMILSGNADVVAAGGVESMSRTEFYIPGDFIKWGAGGRVDETWGFMPRGHGAMSMWGFPLFDRIQRARVMSQPVERFGELNSMMSWAETAAVREGITRREADAWALRSHRKACAAISSKKFSEEILPVTVVDPRGVRSVVDTDEAPRKETSLERLAQLKTVYENGVCTAGNASTENDGAGAVLLMTAARARRLGIQPLAEFVSSAVAAADPTLTYPAVPAAVSRALDRAGLKIAQIDLIEIQEAFAVQTLADAKLMGIDAKDLDRKVNVNGSGISLGHPIGATGTMRLVTLLYELRRRNADYGLVTICGGGGQGIAAVVRRSK